MEIIIACICLKVFENDSICCIILSFNPMFLSKFLLKNVIQCEHCQMQKSIKLLLLDASSLWPGINLLLKYYVWHFLYQNFIGLSWIVCPQHQIEVKEAFQEKVIFSSNSSFSIREVFLPYVLIWRWLEP